MAGRVRPKALRDSWVARLTSTATRRMTPAYPEIQAGATRSIAAYFLGLQAREPHPS